MSERGWKYWHVVRGWYYKTLFPGSPMKVSSFTDSTLILLAISFHDSLLSGASFHILISYRQFLWFSTLFEVAVVAVWLFKVTDIHDFSSHLPNLQLYTKHHLSIHLQSATSTALKMLSQYWVVSALCAVTLAAPTLPYYTNATTKPAEMTILADYFRLLGENVASLRSGEAPVCDFTKASMPEASTSCLSSRLHHNTNMNTQHPLPSQPLVKVSV